MKCKKYLLFLLLIMIIGLNKTYAINKEQINKNLNISLGDVILINDSDLDCSLFGEIDDEGEWHYDSNGEKVIDRPASIRYLVNQVLTYVRIIVPILIILLGSLDFAKAVLAGKEDEMKKAQKTFVMRLIAGVAVFLSPIIVNVIMSLADIVWNGGYTHCDL